VDGEVSGESEEGVRKELALDTDKTTAILAACVLVVDCIGLVVQLWKLAFGHLHAIEYRPLKLSAWYTLIPEVVEKLLPVFILWAALSVWKQLDKVQRFTAVFLSLYFWMGAVLTNWKELDYTVRYSLTVCAHAVDLAFSFLIMVVIVRWFRSIVRYV
jgi:hypothetical protein